MIMTRSRRWAAVLAVGMLPFGLASCGVGSLGSNAEAEAIAAVERAVGVAVPESAGVFVTTATSGPLDRTMRVRVYLDRDEVDADPGLLADAVDRAAASAWASTPITIVELTLEAVPGQRPDVPSRGAELIFDLADAGDALGIDSRLHVDGRLMLPDAVLAERYGAPGDTDQ